MGAASTNMRFTVAILCLVSAAFSAPLGNSEMTDMFSQFKTEFNKVYETETELLQRFEMFTKNVNIINDHNENKAASAGYTMAVNQFTDWTKLPCPPLSTGLLREPSHQ